MKAFANASTQEKRHLLDIIALAYTDAAAWKEIEDICGAEVGDYTHLWKIQQSLRVPGMRFEGR